MNTPLSSFQTASSSLPVGTRLAEFEITGVIGEGGFGIVYSAHDSSLERIVAIKEYLPSAFAQRGEGGLVQVKSEEHRKTFTAGLSSFINEARMLAKFSHPGLVEVFRFWEGNGTAYMAMRYYRGVTLREMLRTSPQLVSEQWLCETLDPILLALKELHNEKCYHRDIAPDNIMVLPNGRSVLMDFGAARRIISGMTQALTTVLKPGYAPIEQYYDDGSMKQGAWTDIYAVGGLLYHLMTGKVPVQAISRMISDPLKPVGEIAAGDFSPHLAAVVMKCLAVLPENRYQSVDELRAALGWVTTPVISTVVHKPPVPEVQDYPATVIISSSTPDRPAVKPAVPVAVNSPAAPVAAVLPVDPDATVITAHVRHPAPEPSFSIDELIGAPATGPQVNPAMPEGPVAAPVAAAAASKGVVGAAQAKSSGSAGPKIAAAVAGVAVLAGAGWFLFGSQKPVEPGSQSASQAQAPAPASVLPAQPAMPVSVPEPPAVPQAVSTPALPEPPPQGAQVPSPPVAALPPVAPVAGSTGSVGGVSASTETMGSVRIELKGGWGNVFVDGEQKGTVPPVLVIKLAAGTHDVEIRNPTVPTEKRSVTVVAGKTIVVRHAFVK